MRIFAAEPPGAEKPDALEEPILLIEVEPQAGEVDVLALEISLHGNA